MIHSLWIIAIFPETISDDPLQKILDPETAGIMAWNKIFVIPNGEGEKVGVLLLDTQGAFDDDSDVKDVTLIFSLSTMISR